MSVAVTISLNNPSRIFCDGDYVSGMVMIDSKAEGKHDGIMLSLEGVLNIQASSKNSRLIDSIVQTGNAKPIVLTTYAKEICKPGKLQAGRTQLSFDFPLKAKLNKALHETFRGVCIIIQYILKCDIKRSLLAKDVLKTQEIFVQTKPVSGLKSNPSSRQFKIKPESLQNVRERVRIPNFLVEGYLNSTELPLSKPVTGELCVKLCERGISSIELQLVRVETCGSSEMSTREVSEIQNLQLCSGDVPRGLAIPIYMTFPRLFTCATVSAPTFKIEFELNIIIIFDNDHLVMENFPITLLRC